MTFRTLLLAALSILPLGCDSEPEPGDTDAATGDAEHVGNDDVQEWGNCINDSDCADDLVCELQGALGPDRWLCMEPTCVDNGLPDKSGDDCVLASDCPGEEGEYECRITAGTPGKSHGFCTAVC